MKTIKVFDYFQKFSYDISKPTSSGALISMISIVVICLLIFIETNKFLRPQIKKDFIILQEESGKSTINFHFSVYIPHNPCSILSVDQEDKLGVHKTNIEAHVTKKRISKIHRNVDLPALSPYKTDDLIQSIEEDEGCLIEGFLEVNKVPGNIHISYHPFRRVFDYLVESQPEKFKKLKLMHKFNYLTLGDKNIPINELNSFGVYPHDEMPNFIERDNKQPNYDYFIKIIPHVLRNEEDNSTKLNYQYSLSFSNRKSEDSEMSMIMINYDMSEVTILVTKRSNNILHFLTHICAIVGGVFVIFSIINRMLQSVFDSPDKTN